MTDARALLRRAQLSPKKSFGQNFLVNEGVLQAIARACVSDDEVGEARVVEIGAGLGALTRALAVRAGRLTAIERDRDLIPLLREELTAPLDAGRLALLEADAQSVDLPMLLGDEARPRVLCGNLPYQITGALLEMATRTASRLDRAVFMVQDEVAERLVAKPSTKAYGALTVFVQAAFAVSRLMKVGPGSFHPPPQVTSSVVVLVPHVPVRAEETREFRALVKAAFGMRRKTLRNAWASVDGVDLALAQACGVSLDARGETLDVEAFARMATALATKRAHESTSSAPPRDGAEGRRGPGSAS